MANLRLSITSVGDLLLNSKITNGTKPIENLNLNIPIYQRPYKWTARNAIQLLDDITEAMHAGKEKYRVGTLILHHSSVDIYDIVDGQQRVITFCLLLKALGENNIRFLCQQLYTNEFNVRNVANNFNALNRRVGCESRNILNGSSQFDHGIESETLKRYIESQCEFIVVITEDISEAFQFFDSQNARGKSLYPHDLLKAYHLREMAELSEAETEKIVKDWEQVSQRKLAVLFGSYLYRIKEWIRGKRATILSEHNIQMFKGITRYANTPYAQFYKAAYSYADMINHSAMPFVSGIRNINSFQLNAPIIAGKPFFEYTKHYYTILQDIQDNSKFEGFYIKDNAIVKTLDRFFSNGTGYCIARLLFDTSLLLYVDRFCPETYPSENDLAQFEQFVVFAFIWAYSLRAQYTNLGWFSAQNYILGNSDKKNAFNIYQLIVSHDTPTSLLSSLADKLCTLSSKDIHDRRTLQDNEVVLGKKNNDMYCSYLSFFNDYGFYK